MIAALLLVSLPASSAQVVSPSSDLAVPGSPPVSGTGFSLSGASVTPSSDTLPLGTSTNFTAIPACSGGPCPDGVTYAWSLTNALGSLAYSTSNSVIARVDTGGEVPSGIAYDSGNGNIYVTNDNAFATSLPSNVSVFNGSTNTLLTKITVGASPTGIAYDRDNGDLYVANCGSSNLSVINGSTNMVVGSLPVTLSGCTIGSKLYMNYAGLAYDWGNHLLYFSEYANSMVGVLNTTTGRVVATVGVLGDPWGLVYVPSSHAVYVTDFLRNTMNVIDDATNLVTTTVTVGLNPSGVDYDAANGDLYVADAGTWVKNSTGFGNVTVVNASTNKVVSTIFVRGYPWMVTYDSANGCIYETDSNSTVLQVISGSTNTVVSKIVLSPPGSYKAAGFAAAYDTENGDLYVSGFNLNIVTVLGGASPSDRFTAGLVPGNVTLWVNATWNGTRVQAPPVPISLYAAPSALVGVSIDPPTGYLLENHSTGFRALPSCTGSPCPSGIAIAWAVNNSLGTLNTTQGPGVNFTAGPRAGSLRLSATASWNGTTETGYAFVTIGASLPVFYPLKFLARGLISGVPWNVTVGGVTLRSTNGSLVFEEANGTYAFTVGVASFYHPSPGRGNITLRDSGQNVTVNFTLEAYAVAFGEVGLASGTSWTVTVGTDVQSTIGPSLTFLELNGTYSYEVPAVSGYSESPSTGSVQVLGTGASVSLLFVPNPTVTSVVIVSAPSRLVVGGLAPLTAEPTCSAGACPPGLVTYRWTVNSSAGSVASSTGTSTIFTAGPDPGPVGVTVVATLNDRSAAATANITVYRIELTSVSITPSTVSMSAGGSKTFTAGLTCGTDPCPSGASFAWSLPPSAGSLSSRNGPSTTVAVGWDSGIVDLTVTVTLQGVTERAVAALHVSEKPGPGPIPFGSSSAPGIPETLVAGVALLTGLVGVALGTRRRNAPPQGPHSSSHDAGPPGHQP